MSLPTSSQDSTGPSKDKVVERFMDFIGTAFDYYSKTEPSKDVNEVYDKIATYLCSITDELSTRCNKSQSVSVDADKPKKEEPKEKIEPKKEDSQGLSSLQESNLSNSIPPAQPPSQKSDISGDNDCRICLESVGDRHFGILEQCDHKYCEPCIRTFLQENQNQSVKCPTCRIKSAKVIFRARFIQSGQEKMDEFNSMLCCESHQPEPAVGQQDIEEGEELLMIEDAESDDEHTIRRLIVIDTDNDPNDPDFVVDIDELEHAEEEDEELNSTFAAEFHVDSDDLEVLNSNSTITSISVTMTESSIMEFDTDTEFVVELSDTADSSEDDSDSD